MKNKKGIMPILIWLFGIYIVIGLVIAWIVWGIAAAFGGSDQYTIWVFLKSVFLWGPVLIWHYIEMGGSK